MKMNGGSPSGTVVPLFVQALLPFPPPNARKGFSANRVYGLMVIDNNITLL